LIHAGAGGVGHVAIQLAKLKGARVITTVSSEQKADFVKGLGADARLSHKNFTCLNIDSRAETESAKCSMAA
jgi:NADPH:quinone reductase-like Zn-dependent oxidoreductase